MKSLVAISALMCAFLYPVENFAADDAMTAGDLQQICLGASAENKAACRFYILGIAQGLDLGMLIADGKTQG